MQITCDLGEGLDDLDAMLMPLIDMASIACGGHAGNRASITRCVRLAKLNNTAIGAHPSYPDKTHFGRKSLSLTANELKASVLQQLNAIQAVCVQENTQVHYIKPHGALYNDMMQDPAVFQTLLQSCVDFNRQHALENCPLVVQAIPNQDQFTHIANQFGLMLMYEAFADRAYSDSGTLVPRSQPGAVHGDLRRITQQCEHLLQDYVETESGKRLIIYADCLCVHSDSPGALEIIQAINTSLIAYGK